MKTILLVLNSLTIGGCFALWLVRNVVVEFISNAGEIPQDAGTPATAEQILDRLLPIFGLYSLALLGLLGLSALYWIVLRIRSGSPVLH